MIDTPMEGSGGGFRSLGRQQLESELMKIREPSAELFGIQLEVSFMSFLSYFKYKESKCNFRNIQ